MRETVHIKVLFDISRTSPNRRLIPALQRQEARFAKETARMAWVELGRPTLAPPVLVTITVKRKRRMDADNAMAACKHLLDGIFKGGIVFDDGPDFVRYGELIQEKPSPLAHPSVTFEVTSLAEEETG